MPDDPDRDPHLLAALRHAPDRDALPPPEVSAAILAQAHAAARQAVPPPGARGPSWWRASLDRWITRPHWAAAFGSIAVAAMVGILWSVNEPPVPGAPAAPAERAAQEPPAQTPAAPSPSAMPPRLSADADTSARAQHNAAAGKAAERAGTAAKAEAANRSGGAEAVGAAPVRERALPATGQAVLATPAAPAAAPPPPAPAPAPEAPLSRNAPASVDESRRSSSQQRMAPAALADTRQAAAADPLAGIDAMLASASGLAWRVADRSVTHGAAQRAWWASVRAASRGLWTSVAAAPSGAPWLTLLQDGQERAALWIDAEAPALVWREGSRVWRAPVDPSAPGRWQQEVELW